MSNHLSLSESNSKKTTTGEQCWYVCYEPRWSCCFSPPLSGFRHDPTISWLGGYSTFAFIANWARTGIEQTSPTLEVCGIRLLCESSFQLFLNVFFQARSARFASRFSSAQRSWFTRWFTSSGSIWLSLFTPSSMSDKNTYLTKDERFSDGRQRQRTCQPS